MITLASPRLLGLLLATCIILSACGDGPLPGETVAQAAEAAESQGSARVFITQSMEVPGQAGGSLVIQGQGAIDFTKQRGSFTYEVAPGSASPFPPDLQGFANTTVIYDGLVMYMRNPALTELAGTRARWFRLDLGAVAEAAGLDSGMLTQNMQDDPTQGLTYLKGAKEVDRVGTESVRGVPTTHYRAVIDMDALLDELPNDKWKELFRSGFDEFPAEVWIDGQGLVRRVRYEFGTEAGWGHRPAAFGPASMSLTIEFDDYGTPVVVRIPPDHSVVDFEDLLTAAMEESLSTPSTSS